MSKSPDEPGNAAPTTPVKHELGQENHGGQQQQNPSRRPPPPTSRRTASSSSLLTRLLASTPEVDEESTAQVKGGSASGTAGPGPQSFVPNANGQSHHTSTESHTNALRPKVGILGSLIGQEETQSPISYWDPKQQASAHQGSPGGSERNNAMATTATMSASAFSLGPSPMSTSPIIDMSDMTHVNNILNSHRAFLNQHRGRGTSLERTHKERRVQTLPMENASINPGDTGMSRPSTPLGSNTLNAQDDSPLDGVRARYRSWRDARPGTVALEKAAWSIGDDEGAGNLSEGQVEKSIADALAGIEPNSRSRKASHSLRFFKEGLPDEPKRKDKDRGRSKDQSQRVKVHANAGSSSSVSQLNGSDGSRDQYGAGPVLSRTVSSTSTSSAPTQNLKLDKEETSQQDTTMDRPNKLPQLLLDDLRKRHNLTPAPKKGYSFSKSIRVTETERHKLAEGEQMPSESSTPLSDGKELTKASQRDEDDESGEEQISSALFVPHQASRDMKQRELKRMPSHAQKAERKHRDSSTELERVERPEQWLVEHQVPSKSDATTPKSPTGDLPTSSLSAEREDTDYFPELQAPSEFGDGVDNASDAGYTSRGYESGVTDGEETTPTGTLKSESHMTKDNQEHLHNHQLKSSEPPAAIELIPYRHQVGGHTTMWRFSKRAVCKQLNNRENEFYEKVEHNHPKLLKFMPRYIGVLNVTFEKNKRKPKDESESNTQLEPEAPQVGEATSTTTNGDGHRMISQSMAHSAPSVTPSVTIADNRHIIPKSFLPSIAAHSYANRKAPSDLMVNGQRSHSQPPPPAGSGPIRPTLETRHANSWGATSVNRALRYEVFGEAFGQSIPVQKHKKPSQRSMPHRPGKSSKLRHVNSDSNLTSVTESQSGEESFRKKAMKTAAERHTTSTDTSVGVPETIPTTDDGTEEAFEEQAGTSAPDPDIKTPDLERQKTKRRRRYSSGALRRKPDEVADSRGNLKYFEEADDAGYRGDGEDDVFKMDPEPSQPATSPLKSAALNESVVGSPSEISAKDMPISSDDPALLPNGHVPTASGEEIQADVDLALVRPVNPNQARTQPDKRVEFFLLLEDLTAGMKRPCIMDLKMGTRQYGVDADAKKQKSQRKKCAATTSQKLGVRVCGLQVWDKAEEKYLFKDKYFGRDLKEGREFQDALQRFLYDGIHMSSVLRHIPRILSKLSKLEAQIKTLKGYRFYAASLLLFYDAEAECESTDGSVNGDDASSKNSGIDFKMADFANCVPADMPNVMERSCPPSHPDQADYGFLRGLRSLRLYFSAIQKEVMEKTGVYVESETGTLEADADESDVGEESY